MVENEHGYVALFVIELVGKSGGLALMWKVEEELEIQNYSQRHINTIMKMQKDASTWKLYGNFDTAKRKESWALLSHLKLFAPT